jgi:hypothetical protein
LPGQLVELRSSLVDLLVQFVELGLECHYFSTVRLKLLDLFRVARQVSGDSLKLVLNRLSSAHNVLLLLLEGLDILRALLVERRDPRFFFVVRLLGVPLEQIVQQVVQERLPWPADLALEV